MHYRRSGAREERRRRVLIDHSRNDREADEASADSGDVSAPRVRYGQSARWMHQPPVTTVIPKRRYVWFVLIGLALSLVAAVQAAYGWVTILAPRIPDWPMLNPRNYGSLAAWLSSSLLSCGAIACVLTYLVRRHRIDDYRGGYRYWLWASAAFLIGSVQASAPIHEMVAYGLGLEPRVTGLSLWLCGGSLILFLLVFETLSSRLSATALGLAFLCYSLATGIELEFLWPLNAHFTIMVSSTAMMLGHLTLVSAVGLYARHVYLDAHELLPERPSRRSSNRTSPISDSQNETVGSHDHKKRKRSDLEDADSAEDEASDTDDKPRKPHADLRQQPSVQRDKQATSRGNQESTNPIEEETEAEIATARLSKSERRRLRKQKRRQRAA